MKDETILIQFPPVEAPEVNLRRLRQIGVELGLEHWDIKPRSRFRMPRPSRRSGLQEVAARAMVECQGESQKQNAAWVLDNLHLLFASETEAREFAFTLSKY